MQVGGSTDKFVVSHVGNLNGQRSPKPYLEAVTLLLADKPELEEKIQIERVVSGKRFQDSYY